MRAGLGATVTAAAITWTVAAAPVAPDVAFRKFLNAQTPREAAAAATDIIQSGVSFDDAFARLRRGRQYSANVSRGLVRLSRRSGDRQYFYDLNVPTSYDPARRYPVRVQLHGGVNGMAQSQPRGDGSVAEKSAGDQIYVLPYAWADAPWWSNAQVENLHAILDSVKRTYNVDENRVTLAGVSDGATATFYVAMRDTTPYANFVSLNGFYLVLNNPTTRAEGELFPNNLLNKPFFVVNGSADPLYPTRIVGRYIEHLQAGGMSLEYWPQEGAGHTTAWWPGVRDSADRFTAEHPRVASPERLTWQTTGEPATTRAHWVVIDRLDDRRGGPSLPDLGDVALVEDDQPPSPKLFVRPGRYARVDLIRSGNRVEATVRGVAAFTLLMSPDVFDFSQPLTVVVNDRVVLERRIQLDLATLIKWAALDNDRTMLFGAELHIPLE